MRDRPPASWCLLSCAIGGDALEVLVVEFAVGSAADRVDREDRFWCFIRGEVGLDVVAEFSCINSLRERAARRGR